MKKELLSISLALVILFSMIQIARAWEMERPSFFISGISHGAVQNAATDDEASVGLGVDVNTYHENEDDWGGDDGVTLRVAATGNTRKAITYVHNTYDELWDWIWANEPTGLTQDNCGAWFDLPFSVRFYGGPGAQSESFTYDRVWVCSNGFLSFDSSNSTSATGSLASRVAPNALMAVYWTDLNPAGGSIKYYSDSMWFVVLWENVLNNNNQRRETFEVAIKNQRLPEYRDQNRFIFLYYNVSGCAQVGIEDQEGYRYETDWPASGKEIDWITEHRAGEIKELRIIAEKDDGMAEIRMQPHDELRGYNMYWTTPEGDQAGLYEVALKGGLTILLSHAAEWAGGLLGGLSMDIFLLTLELAPYFSRELYKVHDERMRDALTSENIAWVNVSAALDNGLRWPVDAELSDLIYWRFKDDDGNHTIKITAQLIYYSLQTHTERNITCSVNITMTQDAGSNIPTARNVAPGIYLAYAARQQDPEDYYSVWVQTGKSLFIKMTPPDDCDFDLYLYSQSGALLASSVTPGDAVERITFYTSYTGYYYIRVYVPPDGGSGLYTLEIKLLVGDSCPFVSVWNGTDYVLDNNLLAASEQANGAETEDYYRLEQTLVPTYEGRIFALYSMQMREFETEHSYVDQVKLLAVDHNPYVNVGVTPTGEILTYENPQPPITCVDRYGNDLLDTLSFPDDQYYIGIQDDYVELDFGDIDTSGSAKLLLRTDFVIEPKCPCVRVQVLDSTGNWIDIITIIPRVHWATDIIDLSSYLSDVSGDLIVRLYFTNIHKLDYVGLDTTPQANIHVIQTPALYAIHTEEGPVTLKLLLNDNVYAELLLNQQIDLGFLLPRNRDGIERTFIFYAEGYYHTITPENP
jgi:hypothetical protein